jgi:hypothetical protein
MWANIQSWGCRLWDRLLWNILLLLTAKWNSISITRKVSFSNDTNETIERNLNKQWHEVFGEFDIFEHPFYFGGVSRTTFYNIIPHIKQFSMRTVSLLLGFCFLLLFYFVCSSERECVYVCICVKQIPALSLEIMSFSASIDADFPNKSLFAKSFR